MKILLLSAYDAASHSYWRHGLYRAFPDHDWRTLTLPARHFSWRIRGNSLTWSQHEAFSDHYDLCIATSMVDLATLRGLVPQLAQIPTLLYFHENQFAYPISERPQSNKNVEPQMVQIYSALAADRLCFNSDFNRQTFLSGVDALMKKLPDGVPKNLVERLQEKSAVLPVGMYSEGVAVVKDKVSMVQGDPITFVWNHRWEYDKGPDRLLAFLKAMPAELDLRFHILGQSFRRKPAEFDQIRTLLEARKWLGQWGYVESKDKYQYLLSHSRFVLSTSIHDFQGLSILEAVESGCLPILPNRLVYPEIFSSDYLYSSEANIDREAEAMAEKVKTLIDKSDIESPSVSAFQLTELAGSYRKVFESLIGSG